MIDASFNLHFECCFFKTVADLSVFVIGVLSSIGNLHFECNFLNAATDLSRLCILVLFFSFKAFLLGIVVQMNAAVSYELLFW